MLYLLKERSEIMNILSITDICNKSSIMGIILFIKELLKITFILVPIGLILILSIDLAKNVIANEDEMKKNINVFIKRILFAVLLFFIPTIMTIATDLLEDAGIFDAWGDKLDTNWKECLDYSTFENLKDLQEIEKIKDEQEREEKQKEYKEALERNKNNNKTNNNGNSYNNNTPSPTLSGNLVKVLLVGNSYTYYNGYGEMLAKMAKSTGKKIIVVRATKGGKNGTELSNQKIEYKCWSSDNSCSNQSGNAKLSKIIKIDFGNKKRGGSWDYIVLQNNDKTNHTIKGDRDVYDTVKGTMKSSKNFIINATYYGSDSNNKSTKRYNKHIKFAKEKNLSVMYSYKIFKTYSSNWKKILQIGDHYHHQSGQGAYMYAVILYSKIYGTNDLASSKSSSNFIKIYNNNGTTKSISGDKYHQGKNGKTPMTVNDKTAKKIQSHVKANYSTYVNNY